MRLKPQNPSPLGEGAFKNLYAANQPAKKGINAQISNKSMSVGVGIGADLGFGFNPRFAVTHHINDRQKLQLNLIAKNDSIKTELDEKTANSVGVNVNMRSFAAEAGYRLFLSETFSVMLGAQIANFGIDIEAYNRQNDKLNMKLTTTQLNATATIGNKWNCNNDMYIGVDWIGFTKNLANSFTKSNRFSNESVISEKTRKELEKKEDDLRNLLASGRLRLLMLDVGYTF